MSSENQKYPLVTVIAACYNHEKYVIECLEAIRNQTYPNIQLIITDDCSTDNSKKIIYEWISKFNIHCKLIINKENLGLPKTLNKALELVEGEYVSIISTDDYWSCNYIERRIEDFEQSSDDVGLIYGRTVFIDDNGDLLDETIDRNRIQYNGMVYRELLNSCFIFAPSVMVRKSCYTKVGIYDESLMIEDYDMWLRISYHYSLKYCDEPLTYRRIHPYSFTISKNKLLRTNIARILLKQLTNVKKDIESRRILENRLIAYRYSLYENNESKATMYLWKGILQKYSKTSLYYLICSILKIPYSTCSKIGEYLTRHI